METYTLSKEQYAEYLRLKKEDILKQAEKIDREIAKVLSGESDSPTTKISKPSNINPDKNKRETVGWRSILEGVFKNSNRALSYSEILEAVLDNPVLDIDEDTARKSISSNLGTYSKGENKRYEYYEKEGKRYYKLYSNQLRLNHD